MVDQLAAEYAAANKPVVFIEYLNTNPLGGRDSRFWVSYYALNGFGALAETPLNTVDSGYQVSQGSVDYYNFYKNMVDTELARAPRANVNATYMRVANRLEANVTVENLSGVDLISTTNKATVGILVYEDIKVGLTNHYARSAVMNPITSLANGAIGTYSIQTADLTTVADWNKLHIIAFVEYNPGFDFADPYHSTKPFEMLQAAVADQLSITASPSNPNLTVTQLSPATHDPIDMTQTVQITGSPSGTTWTVGGTLPGWMTVTPTSGLVNSSAQIQVKGSGLQHGINTGTVQFIASKDGSTRTAYVTLNVTYDQPKLTITPNSLANLLPNQDLPGSKVATLQINGNFTHLPWNVDAAKTPPWVTLTPASGEAGASADVWINSNAIQATNNVGTIVINAYTSKASAPVSIPISYDPPDPVLVSSPGNVVLFTDPLDPKDQNKDLLITGSPGNLYWSGWTATSSADWATITSSGNVGATAKLMIIAGKLAPGQNTATVTFSATKYNTSIKKDVQITVFNMPSQSLFLPTVFRK